MFRMNEKTVQQRRSELKFIATEQEAMFVERQLTKHGYASLGQYRSSKLWAKVRERRRCREGGDRCEICSSTSFCQLHHKTYENLCEEHDEDLVLLCGECHGAVHLHDESGDVQAIEAIALPHELIVKLDSVSMELGIAVKNGYSNYNGRVILLRSLLDYANLHPDLFRKR